MAVSDEDKTSLNARVEVLEKWTRWQTGMIVALGAVAAALWLAPPGVDRSRGPGFDYLVLEDAASDSGLTLGFHDPLGVGGHFEGPGRKSRIQLGAGPRSASLSLEHEGAQLALRVGAVMGPYIGYKEHGGDWEVLVGPDSKNARNGEDRAPLE